MYAVLTGQISDYSWPDGDITYTTPDGTTVSESISLYGDTCVGHRGSDVFPFGLLDDDDDGFEVSYPPPWCSSSRVNADAVCNPLPYPCAGRPISRTRPRTGRSRDERSVSALRQESFVSLVNPASCRTDPGHLTAGPPCISSFDV